MFLDVCTYYISHLPRKQGWYNSHISLTPPLGKNIIFFLVFMYKTREKNGVFMCRVSHYHVKFVGSMILIYGNELHGLYVHVQATMMSTSQVGCKIVIVCVARDLRQRKPALPSGCTLETRLVYCHKFLAPCNNCYVFCRQLT